MSQNQHTIELVREVVERVTGTDLSGRSVDQPLGLDSINRITLLVELEHAIEKPLDSETMTPETFESVKTLAAFIDNLG
ncbi:MAG: acyl carrier protein [Methylosarcina sp.]